MSPAQHAKAFFGLLADLETLFGRHVDLLEAKAIENPYIWGSIQQSRPLLAFCRERASVGLAEVP